MPTGLICSHGNLAHPVCLLPCKIECFLLVQVGQLIGQSGPANKSAEAVMLPQCCGTPPWRHQPPDSLAALGLALQLYC